MPDDNQTYWGSINAKNAAQLLSFAANFGQVSGIAVQVVMGIISLLSESDTDKILGAINQLQVELETDIFQLGNLVLEQSQIIQATVNRNDQASALSQTDGALAELNQFLRSKNPTDLSLANNDSVIGVGFFLNQGQTPPNVFFMPGLVKAGNGRILVMVTQDPNFFKSRPDFVVEIRQMIILLKSMIDEIRQKIDAAHIVIEKDHLVRSQPPRTIIDGYAHEETVVTDLRGTTVNHQLQFFPTTGLPGDPDDPRAATALARAESARSQGVADELAFMAIPGFEAILRNWRTVVVNPDVLQANPLAA